MRSRSRVDLVPCTSSRNDRKHMGKYGKTQNPKSIDWENPWFRSYSMAINYHKWGYPPCLGKKKCTWIACCSIPQISHAFVLRWNGKYKSRLLRSFCLWVLCHPHQLSDVAISVSVSKQIQLQKIFQLFIVLSKRKCVRDGDESEFLWLQFMMFSQIDKFVKIGFISNGWFPKPPLSTV